LDTSAQSDLSSQTAKNIDLGATEIFSLAGNETVSVGVFVYVGVDHDYSADTGVEQLLDRMAAATTGTHDRCGGVAERSLSFLTDEKNLSRVFFTD
jgi:hypothetical protein